MNQQNETIRTLRTTIEHLKKHGEPEEKIKPYQQELEKIISKSLQ